LRRSPGHEDVLSKENAMEVNKPLMIIGILSSAFVLVIVKYILRFDVESTTVLTLIPLVNFTIFAITKKEKNET